MLFIWLKFVVCALIIFIAGKCVAKYGDVIAEKTSLGGLWIGFVLVAVCTSLPEIFTGIGSVVFLDAPNLTMGNIIGANTYNLLNLALLDFLYKGPPLLSVLSTGQLLTAGLSLFPLTIAMLGILLSKEMFYFNLFHVSIYSVLILIIYLISSRIIFQFEKTQLAEKIKEQEETVFKYKEISLANAFLFYVISAAFIVAAGIWLAYIGEELSHFLGWEKNFVGGLFLGFATTLPEITVSASALSLGAVELAVANMLGSNLFNLVIIFINDLFYRKAPIFQAISEKHLFSGFVVITMTLIVITGLIVKPKRKKKWLLSGYSIALILVFLLGTYINFILQAK